MINFGRDTWCLEARRTGKYASGVVLIAQRLYRALTTPRRSLRGSEEELAWGDDISEIVGTPGGRSTEARIRAIVQRAASKDETIASVAVGVVSSTDSVGDSTHTVTVEAETSEGPFALVLAIGAVKVDFVGLSS